MELLRSTRTAGVHACRVWARVAVAAALVAAVFAAQLALPTAASAAPTASLSGVVTDADGVPLESVCVWSPSGGATSTDAAGTWMLSGLEAGSYKVLFSDCSAQPRFLAEWFDGASSEAAATAVPVAEGEAAVLPTVQLALGVVFTGVVTDTSGAPLEGMSVSVMSTSTPDNGWAVTAADGTYRSTPVPAGTYRVQFSDPSPSPVYARELFDDEFRWNEAQLVAVDPAVDPVRAGVDAQMVAGATLSGVVSGPSGPIGDVCVTAVDASTFDWFASTVSVMSGAWTLPAVAPTDVKVQFRDCTASPTLVEQWWDTQGSFSSAQVLSLTPGQVLTGMDATLVSGTVVSGTVTDTSGAPLPGISVSVMSAATPDNGWAVTAADGTYRSTPVPPGTYRVQFRDDSQVFATEFFDDAPTWESATLVDVAGAERPGVDATLERAATVQGVVSGPGGAPAANVCVNVLRGDRAAPQWVAGARTDAAGAYSISALPSGPSWVVFVDCDAVGPFRTQFFDDADSIDAAATLELVAGETISGVDAELELASAITGRVTGPGGVPLAGVCVQASTASMLGDLVRTDGAGNFRLLIDVPGAYRVQFVDCDSGAHVGVWFGGGADPASALWVSVVAGETMSGVDVELAVASGSSSVSGVVSNVRGDGLSSCVVLFLPNEVARFAQTDAEGRFRFDGVPSGSWFVASAGCGPDGPTPLVPDVGGSGASFAAEWFDDVAVEWGSGTPDPFAQGAELLVVTPGVDVVADVCLGCEQVSVSSVEGSGSAEASVAVALSGVDVGAGALTFEVACAAPGAPAVSGSGPASPVSLSGLEAGAVYGCVAFAAVNGLRVASSLPFEVPGPPAPPAPPEPPVPPAPPVPADGARVTPAAAPAAGLAFTGAATAGALVVGVTLLALGLALWVSSRRQRRDRRPGPR